MAVWKIFASILMATSVSGTSLVSSPAWADNQPPAQAAGDSDDDQGAQQATQPSKPTVNPANQTYGAKGRANSSASAQPQDASLPADPELRALLSSGYQAFRSGQLDKAIKLLGEAVKRNNSCAQAHRYLALSLYNAGVPGQAVGEFLKLAKLVKPSAFDQYSLGEAYFACRDFESARNCFKDALNQDSTMDAAHGGLIKSEAALKDFDEALKECNKGLSGAKDQKTQNYYKQLIVQVKRAKESPGSAPQEFASPSQQKLPTTPMENVQPVAPGLNG